MTLPPAPKHTLKGGHRTVAALFGVHPLGCCGGSQAWWQCQDAPELLDVIVNDFVGTRLQ
jgi:hypothetical protein